MLTKDYKFYLSFENSVCTDYVTEKFFNRFADWIVPIVLNRKIHAKVAPDDPFIAADDSDSPESLANYLKFLDKNPLEYLKFFSWRKRFSLNLNVGVLCGLCRKLWTTKSFGKNKTRLNKNMVNNNQSLCRT